MIPLAIYIMFHHKFWEVSRHYSQLVHCNKLNNRNSHKNTRYKLLCNIATTHYRYRISHRILNHNLISSPSSSSERKPKFDNMPLWCNTVGSYCNAEQHSQEGETKKPRQPRINDLPIPFLTHQSNYLSYTTVLVKRR